MDVTLIEAAATALATVVPILVAYLRKTITSKGISEEQSELIFEVIEDKLEELVAERPTDTKLVAFNKTFKKLKKMWFKDSVTTEEMMDFLEELE